MQLNPFTLLDPCLEGAVLAELEPGRDRNQLYAGKPLALPLPPFRPESCVRTVKPAVFLAPLTSP